MEETQQIEHKINEIKRMLGEIGDMRPGSLSMQKRSWNGEYCQLSYSHRGKGHTEYIRMEDKEEVERQIENYRRVKELTREWVGLGIELCKLRLRGLDEE